MRAKRIVDIAGCLAVYACIHSIAPAFLHLRFNILFYFHPTFPFSKFFFTEWLCSSAQQCIGIFGGKSGQQRNRAFCMRIEVHNGTILFKLDETEELRVFIPNSAHILWYSRFIYLVCREILMKIGELKREKLQKLILNFPF